MCWLYVPATAASNSDCTLQPAGRLAASVTWSAKLRAPRFWSRKWKRVTWLQRLSGLTSPRSMLWRGVERWIASLRGSRANPPALPARVRAQQTLVGFGRWYRVSSKTRAPSLSFSKTCQGCGRKGCAMCSKTLPRWGSMRSGVVSVQPRLAPARAETGSGSWPTATASSYGNNHGGGAGRVGKKRPSLAGAAKSWPTPTAKGNHNRKGLSPNSGDGLATSAKRWATPTTSQGGHRVKKRPPAEGGDMKLSPQACKHGRPDPTAPAGQPMSLNPRFVERLMGTPCHWVSASGCSATEWSLWWQRQRSVLSSAERSVKPSP